METNIFLQAMSFENCENCEKLIPRAKPKTNSWFHESDTKIEKLRNFTPYLK